MLNPACTKSLRIFRILKLEMIWKKKKKKTVCRFRRVDIINRYEYSMFRK